MKHWLSVVLLAVAGMGWGQDRPVPPTEAAARMTLPPGFQATLFAGEPDVVQPIAFSFDDRGRLWVAECLSYPKWGKEGHDRIVIFEDANGDGRFDTGKVFCDNIANLSGLALGFGGVWACATPNLLFIPDRDGDDKPDGPAKIVLDGWDLTARHNVFNGLAWGPDGWLYGCNGILSNSKIGKPRTPEDKRVRLNCGVWRYHPTRERVEWVATGTTNPWGLDFDDYGQMFITNCVIHHLWHVIPGAHYQRMFGQDFNPHWYELMASCADHIHWGGGAWQSSRGGIGSHDAPGGGHAHAGAMVYLGDNWPDSYRNSILMCNIHGNRLNRDVLERKGSGYVAHHGKDFLLANDPWFRGLAVHQGPDGGVFVSDWCDTGECHDYDDVHRSSGRIYKITYGKPKTWIGNLARLSDAELVREQLNKNDWQVRHARRILQERAAAGKLAPGTHEALRQMLKEQPEVTRKLRALWALHVTGGLDEKLVVDLIDNSPHADIRAWAFRLALDNGQPHGSVVHRMSEGDPSPVVRLALASGLQRLPLQERWPVARALVKNSSDAQDLNLPLMIWYGIEPLVSAEMERAPGLIGKSAIPVVRQYLSRRLAGLDDIGLNLAVSTLSAYGGSALQLDVLRGIDEALVGRRRVAMPRAWPEALRELLVPSQDSEIRQRALALGALFGDPAAVKGLWKSLENDTAPVGERLAALQALLSQKDPALGAFLLIALKDPALRGTAIRGLAVYDDKRTPLLVLKHYAQFTDSEKADAVQTLASRPAYAMALLDAIEKGVLPRRDLSPFTVRQMLGFKQKNLVQKLTKVWGAIRPASQEKSALMARYKNLLKPDYVQQADLSAGRRVFGKTCAACHRLFDDGGAVGPDITGAQRNNLDYVLENLLDPSALVYGDYQVTTIETKDGRVLNGIVKRETDKAVTLQTQNEAIVVPKDEIEHRLKSPLSLMPEGLLANLKDEEVRDLIAYLASPKQVPK